MAVQVSISKEDGYCRRICSQDDTTAVPVVQVVVTAESPSHWNKQYIPQLKTAIETEWQDQLGQTY